jgi:SAM-dependent methyltransferase
LTLRTSFSYLKKALLTPEPALNALPLWRHLLLKPVLFESVATVMQIRDAAGIRQLSSRASSGDAYVDLVADYNAGVTQTKSIVVSRAAEPLLKAMSLRWADYRSARLLIIGPRTIQELYLAWLYGFAWKNIEAIDLFGTNQKIRVMNMESMSFPDASFDAVLASKTVSYASDLARCIGEIARVLKPGGRAAFTHSYTAKGTDFRAAKADEDDLRRILSESGLQPYFFQSGSKMSRGNLESMIHLVAATKA